MTTGITLDSQAEDYTATGLLNVHGFFQAAPGTSVTVSAATVEGLAVGTGSSVSYTADGTVQHWTAYVAPLTGSWGLGTAVVAAVLLDTSNVQLATAQNISVLVIPLS